MVPFSLCLCLKIFKGPSKQRKIDALSFLFLPQHHLFNPEKLFTSPSAASSNLHVHKLDQVKEERDH